MGKRSAGSSKEEKVKVEKEKAKEMDAKILKVMLMYHEDEKQNVKVEDVADELGLHSRNKIFRVRWSILKNQRRLIGNSKSGEGVELTKLGLDEAATPEYKARMKELAITPKTNSEHQEKIKKYLKKPKSAIIFDFLVKYGSLSKSELSYLVHQNPRSHAFHYSFNELRDKGYLEVDPGDVFNKDKKFHLTDKAFKSKDDRPKENDINRIELLKEVNLGHDAIEARKTGPRSKI